MADCSDILQYIGTQQVNSLAKSQIGQELLHRPKKPDLQSQLAANNVVPKRPSEIQMKIQQMQNRFNGVHQSMPVMPTSSVSQVVQPTYQVQQNVTSQQPVVSQELQQLYNQRQQIQLQQQQQQQQQQVQQTQQTQIIQQQPQQQVVQQQIPQQQETNYGYVYQQANYMKIIDNYKQQVSDLMKENKELRDEIVHLTREKEFLKFNFEQQLNDLEFQITNMPDNNVCQKCGGTLGAKIVQAYSQQQNIMAQQQTQPTQIQQVQQLPIQQYQPQIIQQTNHQQPIQQQVVAPQQFPEQQPVQFAVQQQTAQKQVQLRTHVKNEFDEQWEKIQQQEDIIEQQIPVQQQQQQQYNVVQQPQPIQAPVQQPIQQIVQQQTITQPQPVQQASQQQQQQPQQQTQQQIIQQQPVQQPQQQAASILPNDTEIDIKTQELMQKYQNGQHNTIYQHQCLKILLPENQAVRESAARRIVSVEQIDGHHVIVWKRADSNQQKISGIMPVDEIINVLAGEQAQVFRTRVIAARKAGFSEDIFDLISRGIIEDMDPQQLIKSECSILLFTNKNIVCFDYQQEKNDFEQFCAVLVDLGL